MGRTPECISSGATKSNMMSKVRVVISTENQLKGLMRLIHRDGGVRLIKSLGGLEYSGVWYQHLLSDDTLIHLAESYNNFLVNLTSHFNPLAPCHDAELLDVPNEFLVNYSQVYTSLRQIRTNKSPGPDIILNKLLKIFVYEFAPVLADIIMHRCNREFFSND